MKFGIVETLTLLGSLGIFLFGMKLMSESLQKAAGEKLRNILAAMTSNRVKGIFTGVLITAIIQSSSATTVMVVSFVNAGLISLTESIGVIMGANIGTTITAWLISILGFKVSMAKIAIPIIGVGFPLLFSKRTKRKNIGELIIGFALLFIGLGFLKENVPDISVESLGFLGSGAGLGFISLLFFLLIGTLLTVVIQSSSATMALTLVLAANGTITFEMAAAMVLGENIGTTITANMAAIVANTSAKRAARAHLIFNSFGVIWILIVFYPFIKFIDLFMVFDGAGSPLAEKASIPIALSIFHTVFNILNVLIMVWFIPLIVKLVTKMVKDKEDDEEFRLKHINTGMLATPELSILQAREEIFVYAERVTKMFGYVKELFSTVKEKKFEKLYAKILKYEEISDRMEVEIAEYLAKVSESELSVSGSRRIKAMFEVIDDIESVGDSCYNLAKAIRRKKDGKIVFPDDITENINKMFDLVDSAYYEMNNTLNSEFSNTNIDKAKEIENLINKYRNRLREEHILNVKSKKYKYKAGVIYNELFSTSEKLGDYIINISESVKNVRIHKDL
ncbi:MAG: Na/Pi cotransporter family protein [Bacteroidales bacterium]|nr:Na/Pi cotransporter family protein [Bacteroidales bacterium]